VFKNKMTRRKNEMDGFICLAFSPTVSADFENDNYKIFGSPIFSQSSAAQKPE